MTQYLTCNLHLQPANYTPRSAASPYIKETLKAAKL